MAASTADMSGSLGVGTKPPKAGSVRIQDIARFGGRNIIDIRRDRDEIPLRDEIHKGLHPAAGGEKRLPTLLLYDELGLKLFEEITYLDEYYLTNTEIEILEAQANDIALQVAPGSIIVELGSGNLRKVDILLKAIDHQGKDVEYFALDLSLAELERTLSAIPKGSYNHVQCFGLHGTYDDGLEWLKKQEIMGVQKMVLSLGSSIGNFSRTDAAQFLKDFADIMQPKDAMLIAVDGCKDASRVYHAYNDRHGTTHKFIANGLLHANEALGKKCFDPEIWRVIGEYNVEAGRHQAFVSPSADTMIDGAIIKKDERVRIEESYKYDEHEVNQLFRSAGVVKKAAWTNQKKDYVIHMVAKLDFAFGSKPQSYAPFPVPTWEDWVRLWQAWDAVSRDMIPDDALLEKPIKLRNACIFYLGHIPTFFDMKLAEVTGDVHTEPLYFTKIFERGIDPDVDDPEQCHAHSEVPDEWPPLEDILAFQKRVRQRVKAFYDSGAAYDPNIARALWLGYEHEAMHMETLLYMLIQSNKTRIPPSVTQPDFELLAEHSTKVSVPNEWIKVPESDIELGIDDPETTSGPSRFFGWDIEKPQRKEHVHAFEAKARPITIGEYAQYMHAKGIETIPASWVEEKVQNGHANSHAGGDSSGQSNGEITSIPSYLENRAVRTFHGLVPLKHCVDWPVSASYDEILGCAAWMGGRIPTFEEARSIYAYVDDQQKNSGSNAAQKTIPAVNSHLINNGVRETPPAKCDLHGVPVAHATGNDMKPSYPAAGGPDPRDVFVDVSGANVGFQHWHPTPVTGNGSRLSGQGDFGGVWEWTSTSLAAHKGYAPMPLYPAYSADFFDGKHNIILGGSWATVPRIAGRKSFVNWYQRNYPYVWAGARLVRDL